MAADKKVVFVDVDDVCALLHVEWLRRYNKDYNDNLTDKDMTDWGLHKLVKPECGVKIYSYLRCPDLYDNVLPREGALNGVNTLRELGYRVLFASSCCLEVVKEKFLWLLDFKFLKMEEEFIVISDKSLLKGDYMIDDCYEKVRGFSGYGYLLSRPWNSKYNWHYRVVDWDDFIKVMTANAVKGM